MTSPWGPRTIVEQYMRRCRHFTGIQNDTCKKEVTYRDFVATGVALIHSLPCVRNADAKHCEHRSFPSRKEAEEYERQIVESEQRMTKARQAIVDATEGQHPVRGHIDCPACSSGTLAYSVASSGHIWAACSTKDCVRWTEWRAPKPAEEKP